MSDELPDDLVWLTPLRPRRGLLEPWLRRAAVAPDGLIFLPAALVGKETTAHLAAWEDDVPTVYDDTGHAYVPSHWLAETFPSIAPLCQLIERRCYDQMAAAPEPTTP